MRIRRPSSIVLPAKEGRICEFDPPWMSMMRGRELVGASEKGLCGAQKLHAMVWKDRYCVYVESLLVVKERLYRGVGQLALSFSGFPFY